jgi:glycosyltransferase involved in cell wall biosynthesis
MSDRIGVLELLPTSTPGGGPKQVYDLVRELPKSEFEVVVGAPRDGVFFERFQALGLRVVEFPRRRLGLRHLRLAIRLIRQFDIAIVHTHGKGPGLYGRLAAWWTGASAVHTFHGIHYADYSPIGRWFYLALERQLSRLSRTIINVSASQSVEGLGLRLFKAEQNAVVVNGIASKEISRAMSESPVRRDSLALTADDVVLGCISRFDPIKRLEVLLATVQRLVGRLPRVTLLLVGAGTEEDRIRRLTFDMGLQDRVIFTGFLENPARVYPALDLYVTASQKEGLPLSLVEAMCAGLAVVATDVPGHRDVVIHGETGLLVPPNDSAALADAIAELITDPDRRKAMGEAGRRRALEEFGIRLMVDATAAIFRRARASQPSHRDGDDG